MCTCMQKINCITPTVFEILKLKNPAMWLSESMFAFNHAHLKLHEKFVALIDLKLHTQNEIYNSIDILKSHTHLNLHNQFITLLDMKLRVQNQLYTSFSFWDCKALIASLGIPGHALPHPPKITSLICSFNRYVPACKKSTL